MTWSCFPKSQRCKISGWERRSCIRIIQLLNFPYVFDKVTQPPPGCLESKGTSGIISGISGLIRDLALHLALPLWLKEAPCLPFGDLFFPIKCSFNGTISQGDLFSVSQGVLMWSKLWQSQSFPWRLKFWVLGVREKQLEPIYSHGSIFKTLLSWKIRVFYFNFISLGTNTYPQTWIGFVFLFVCFWGGKINDIFIFLK